MIVPVAAVADTFATSVAFVINDAKVLALPESVNFPPIAALPVMFAVPVILAPVPVTTTMFALPTAESVLLPFEEAMLTFELPFEIESPVVVTVAKLRPPEPFVCRN